jgi:hypothetical protein
MQNKYLTQNFNLFTFNLGLKKLIVKRLSKLPENIMGIVG